MSISRVKRIAVFLIFVRMLEKRKNLVLLTSYVVIEEYLHHTSFTMLHFDKN